MPSLAVRREAEPDAGQREDADARAADLFAALASAVRLIEALAETAPEHKPLYAMALVRLNQGTQAAEELRDELKSREIRVRALAEAAVAADAASRRLRVV